MKILLPMIIILLLAAFIALAVLQWQYRSWPQYLWAARVRRRLAELRSRLDELIHPPRSERSAAEKLAEELFEAQKQSVGVEALARYDGIGPKIVGWLQEAGIRTLAHAEDHAKAFTLFKKKIEKIGTAREEDIAKAVTQLLADERRRFDAGTSPQGQSYQEQLTHLSAAEQDRVAARLREQTAIEQCLTRSREIETISRDVSFFNYLFHRDVPGLTDEVMAEPLPTVEVKAAAPTVPTPVIVEARKPNAPLPGVAKLQAYCRFGLLMAKVDGRIVASERGRIRVFLGEQFGSDPVLLRHLDPQLEAAEANLPSEDDAIAAIKALTTPGDWAALYRFAEQVADASGGRVDKEKQFLARLATAFDLAADETIEEPVETPVVAKPVSPPPPVSTARDVLGIAAKTEITVELVRRKYTMLIEQICPEKAAQLGPEFAAMAVAKREAIKAAAEELLAPLNAPLEAPAPPVQKNQRENSDLDDLFGSLNRG